MPIDVDRATVLGYRMSAQQLDRRGTGPADLAVLGLGVQDSPPGAARLALNARLEAVPDGEVDELGDLVMAWTHRGAPHLHRAADLTGLAAALWPHDDRDALSRLAWQRSQVAAAGMPALQALRRTADELRTALHAPMTKGALSEAVTALVPESLTLWCRGCQATHVHEQLMRLAGLPGGARLVAGSAPLQLAPVDGWPGPPDAPSGTEAVILDYLRLLGPATAAEVAAFFTSTRSTINRIWPAGLEEVRVEGRPAWLPADRVDALRAARPDGVVRLLPHSDPYLQARDRTFLVPDKTRHKALWTILGSPGAVLVDGEIVGSWRAKLARRNRLELTVRAFDPIEPTAMKELWAEAERMAAVRGAADVELTVD